MAISTYDELKQAVASWLERDDLGSRIDDFIMLAERQISRDLRASKMEDREFLTTTANKRFYPLPNNYLEQRDFHIDLSSGIQSLESVSPKALDSKTGSRSPGIPRFYAIHGTEFELSPTPDDSYRIEMTFFEKPIELSDTNQTNVYITEYPDLILYASLLNAKGFLMDEGMIGTWSNAYQSIITQENRSAKKGRYGVAPAMTLVGSTVV